MKQLTLVLLLLPAAVSAQEQPEAAAAAQPANWHQNLLIVALLCVFVLFLLACMAILKAVKIIEKEAFNPTPYVKPAEARFMEYDEWKAIEDAKPGFWVKLMGLKPIEQEKDIMLEHEFDGIAELDNPTPAWFMWLFYGTMVFAAAYLLNYHVLGYGRQQYEEYTAEMQQAKAAQLAYLARSANNIDENSVKASSDPADLTAGKAVYTANCVACHGDHAQGVVGPNLTDEYWLHGGRVNDIFKTIKYGVPEKGMITWEKKLSPKQIADVSNFILSLKGSKPANAKAPQGDKEG